MLPAENVQGAHLTHVLSVVVEPAVQTDPSPQAVASGYAQAAQASLSPAEYVPPVHSTHVLSVVALPAVQTVPSGQAVASAGCEVGVSGWHV